MTTITSGRFYIGCYRRRVSNGRTLAALPDHAAAIRMMAWLNDLELANYRLASRREQRRQRPRKYYITDHPVQRGKARAEGSLHRWAYWYYTPAIN